MQASRRNRRRLPRSCEECRRRKVKCDRSHPCSHCVLSKCRCVYNNGPHLRLVHPDRQVRQVPALSDRPHTRQEVDTGSGLNSDSSRGLGSHLSSSTVASTVTNGGPAKSLFSHSFGPIPARDPETANPASDTLLLELPYVPGMPTSRTESSPSVNLHKDHDRLDNQSLVLHKSRLFGQTHWSNAVYEFKTISAFMRSETTNSGGHRPCSPYHAEVQLLLQQCKQLSKSIKPQRPGRSLSRPEPIVSLPAMADHLVHLYESNIETAFRILHRPTLRKEYEKYKVVPTGIADVTMLKIQLVMAIGLGLSPNVFSSTEARELAYQWLHASQDWLSGPIEKDRLSIDGIQVHCLLILARQVLSVGSDLSWVSMGTLLRTAMQIGLHRDPKHFSSLSNLEREVRRRLWATILELNAQAALDSGTPSGINFDDFDTSLPGNINDEDMDEIGGEIKYHHETTQTDTTLQRFLMRCLPPRLEIIRRMNNLGADLHDEHILELSAKLNTACREVDAQVWTSGDPQASKFKRNLSSLLLRRFLLVLHRPLAGRIRENALYYHSRKMSFDSAMALLKPPVEHEAFSYLMLHGGGLFKSCLIHASLALASELLIEIEEQGSSTYRKMLIEAVREAHQQWEKRLRLGDTSFRLHMKLSIVLGLSEHSRGEADQELCMVQSTKDSLELCHSLIREHVRSESSTTPPECYDWRSPSLHAAGSNWHMDSSGQLLNFEDILQMSDTNIGGAFERDVSLL